MPSPVAAVQRRCAPEGFACCCEADRCSVRPVFLNRIHGNLVRTKELGRVFGDQILGTALNILRWLFLIALAVVVVRGETRRQVRFTTLRMPPSM